MQLGGTLPPIGRSRRNLGHVNQPRRTAIERAGATSSRRGGIGRRMDRPVSIGPTPLNVKEGRLGGAGGHVGRSGPSLAGILDWLVVRSRLCGNFQRTQRGLESFDARLVVFVQILREACRRGRLSSALVGCPPLAAATRRSTGRVQGGTVRCHTPSAATAAANVVGRVKLLPKCLRQDIGVDRRGLRVSYSPVVGFSKLGIVLLAIRVPQPLGTGTGRRRGRRIEHLPPRGEFRRSALQSPSRAVSVPGIVPPPPVGGPFRYPQRRPPPPR